MLFRVETFGSWGLSAFSFSIILSQKLKGDLGDPAQRSGIAIQWGIAASVLGAIPILFT